jgi:hypothetical protein
MELAPFTPFRVLLPASSGLVAVVRRQPPGVPIMKDSLSVIEADLDYAERMVRKGFGNAEQAAQTCGVRLADLLARLAHEPQPKLVPHEKQF